MNVLSKAAPPRSHHCDGCVAVPAETQKILERLNHRMPRLENQSRRLQKKPAAPAS